MIKWSFDLVVFDLAGLVCYLFDKSCVILSEDEEDSNLDRQTSGAASFNPFAFLFFFTDNDTHTHTPSLPLPLPTIS